MIVSPECLTGRAGGTTLYPGSSLPDGEGNIVLYKKGQDSNTEVLLKNQEQGRP
jgi:hypothetical protein